MKHFHFPAIVLLSLSFLDSSAQINAGPDVTICQPQPVTLTATAVNVSGTSNYTTSAIAWAPEVIGGTTINLSDDAVSSVQPIGFTFCFFGNSYTQFYIGSNGWISFSPGQPSTYTSATIPSTGASVPKNCIMGPWQDWHPGISPGNFIKYQTIGIAPNRKLVVTWDNVPMFSCTSTLARFQIVLHESTNLIDNHLFNKPFCSWAGGTAVQGLHNAAGNFAITVPGRNSTVWTAINESWRYTPTGPPNLQWQDLNGNVLSTSATLNVTPQQTTTYVALPLCGSVELGDQVTVFLGADLQMQNSVVTPASCNSAVGSINLILNTSSPGPFNYQWNDPASSTSEDLSGLGPGAYTVTVTDQSNGCIDSETFTIEAQSTLSLQASAIPVSCFGDANGSATVTATSQFPGYTYSWNDPLNQSSATASGLPAATYVVTVTDADGCTENIQVEVGSPLPLEATVQNLGAVSCAGGSDGAAEIDVAGGTSPYSYLWSNGFQQPNAISLPAGEYTVDVEDSNGCTVSASFSVDEPEAVVVDLQVTPVSCSPGNDGAVTAVPSGGVEPYVFLWTASGSTSDTEINLAAGEYELTVTDGNGCAQTLTAQVEDAVELDIVPTIAGASCAGASDASVSVQVSGGTPGYTYQWDDPSAQTGPEVSDLPSGTYSVLVTDAEGCIEVLSVQVPEPAPVGVEILGQSDVLCAGGSTGSAQAAATGGTPGYTYLWNGQNLGTSPNSLSADTYQVDVTDSNGCTGSAVVVIGEPQPLSYTISTEGPSCFDSADGTALVTVSGGVGNYEYFWVEGIGNGPLGVNISGGDINIVDISDANSCHLVVEFSLDTPPILLASVTSTPATCGLDDGTATADASGGTGTLSYSWPATGDTGSSVLGLEAGVYQVVVTDENGCTGTASGVVEITGEPVAGISADVLEGYIPLDLTFGNTSQNGDTFIWDFGNGETLETDDSDPVIASYPQAGTFEVSLVAVSPGGCVDTAFVTVSVFEEAILEAFNIFSPNGDDKNDSFLFRHQGILDFECTIFNRWGQELYSWDDPDEGWDGNSGGAECAEGTYWYVVKARGADGEDITREGYVTLVR